MNELTENSYTWQLDAFFIVFRYLFFAGLAYFVFYQWRKKYLLHLRIVKDFPGRKSVIREIGYSTLTLLIFCTGSWLMFYSYTKGYTALYANIGEYGMAYFVASIFIMILLHDAYFYWTHRILHLPILFRRIHRIHHLSVNPTPWASFAFHPVEALLMFGIIPVIVFLLPSHPYAIFLFLTYMTFVNVMGHLGYETFSKSFRKNRYLKFQNSASNHHLHHQDARSNYGLYFTFWDRFMKTFRTGTKD